MPLDMLDMMMNEESLQNGKLPDGVDEDVFRRNQAEMREIVMKMGADQRPPEQELTRLRNRLMVLKAECEGQPPPEEEAAPSQGPQIAQFSGSSGVVGAHAIKKHDVFQGGGSRLGGTASSSTPASSGYPAASEALREVDPDGALVRIKVQLLSRRPAQVVVNSDFTIRELRAWLAHYQGPESGDYHLMDVSSFPPKRLSDLNATISAAGITGKSSLSCRPAGA
eukprot:TRINITY_DN107891_c0_g1_i1.p1 TRINITY_DN107891_c0_g1~~TRINITY_DN107891_c0_g1_i1.p1  ORF type:complete len:224 (+),score=55.71 TRINITY_DN107891_c0_g1_i1:25-696(+)